MFLKLARAALDRGWMRTYRLFFEIDLVLSGLGGVSRRIERERRDRRNRPFVRIGIDGLAP